MQEKRLKVIKEIKSPLDQAELRAILETTKVVKRGKKPRYKYTAYLEGRVRLCRRDPKTGEVFNCNIHEINVKQRVYSSKADSLKWLKNHFESHKKQVLDL